MANVKDFASHSINYKNSNIQIEVLRLAIISNMSILQAGVKVGKWETERSIVDTKSIKD